eukprot:428202-Prymnesium_polylepis.1
MARSELASDVTQSDTDSDLFDVEAGRKRRSKKKKKEKSPSPKQSPKANSRVGLLQTPTKVVNNKRFMRVGEDEWHDGDVGEGSSESGRSTMLLTAFTLLAFGMIGMIRTP